MSETPRTDAARQDEHDPYMAIASECSKMEKELNAASQRIKRLEEAGDRMRLFCADPDDCFAWDKAKEAKL
jgi:hypothetical protein